ncbi:MAG TPA: DUF4916 domain-containing protein [Candidatus Binatia bacterium]|jgi:8-oxo-dGTP diphosphatase|nr:DUF4916 domain-containing protein [Candidatus Binatia bacterium]
MEKKTPKKRAEAAVVGIITDRKGRVLLTRRTREPMAGMWHMAGGAVDYGETLEEALVRELREEIGVEATVLSRLPIAICSTVYPSVERHVIALYFRVSIKGKPEPKDATDAVAWLPQAQVRELYAAGKLLDSCRSALEHALGWKLL